MKKTLPPPPSQILLALVFSAFQTFWQACFSRLIQSICILLFKTLYIPQNKIYCNVHLREFHQVFGATFC